MIPQTILAPSIKASNSQELLAFVVGQGDHMEEYKDGWPRIPGWYDCLVDGEQMRLKFYVCQVSRKPHWLDEDGNYIESMYKVKWRNENS